MRDQCQPVMPRRLAEECLGAVEQILENRFPYMSGRGVRVANLSQAIADSLPSPHIDTYTLRIAAQFHDVGMLAIPDGVLLKRDKFSSADLTAIRQHPAVGAKLVAKFFPDLPAATAAIVYHHERPDGGGIYGLRGDKIPLTVSIIAVAGAVEAMANDRPHRKAMSPEQILDELRQGRARQFAADVVDAFLPYAQQLIRLALVTPPAPPPPPAPTPLSTPLPACPVPAAPKAPSKVQQALVGDREPDGPPPGSPPPPRIMREQALKRLEQAMASKTPSPVGARVVALSASSGAEVADLAGIISTDPVLAARVLDVANSAAYSANRRLTTTVQDAVRTVGLSTVRNIATALGMFDAVPAVAGDDFSLVRYWQHSLAVARLTEELTAGAEPDRAGVAYLAGLCHELGTIVFHSQFADEYRYVLAEHEHNGKEVEELERQALGITRRELESAVLDALKLPEGVHTAIRALQTARAPAARDGAIVQALACADFMACGMLLAPTVRAPVRPLTRRMLPSAPPSATPGTTPHDPPNHDAESFASDILALTATLARLSSDEQADLTRPLFPRKETPVWLARSPEYSSYDPIAAALAAVADLRIENRLPSPDEMRQIEKLVVILPGRANDAPISLFSVVTLLDQTPISTLALIEPAMAAKAGHPDHPALTIKPCLIPLDRLVRFINDQ